MLKKIIVGLDGSKGSFKALEEGLLLAALANTELHTISVEEVPRFPGTIGEVVEEKDAQDTRFGAAIAQAEKMAREKGVTLCPHVLVGHEVQTMVEFVKENGCDLLILGFMGHSAIYDRIMGGTCQNLLRLAPCSVLVVK
jgi:nucleotide-binding universal stress UspA family protein